MVDPCVPWDLETESAVPLSEDAKPALEGVPADVDGFAVQTVFEIIRESVAEWTVEKASQTTGVSADDIRELARTYAQDGPVTTFAQYGLNHYNNGTYNYGPLFSLVLITGNIGKPGAGCGIHTAGMGLSNSAGCLAAPSTKGEPPQGGGRNINWNQLYPVLQSGQKLGEPFPMKALTARARTPCAPTPSTSRPSSCSRPSSSSSSRR